MKKISLSKNTFDLNNKLGQNVPDALKADKVHERVIIPDDNITSLEVDVARAPELILNQ